MKWLIVISQMIGTNKTAEEVREKIKKQKERKKEKAYCPIMAVLSFC